MKTVITLTAMNIRMQPHQVFVQKKRVKAANIVLEWLAVCKVRGKIGSSSVGIGILAVYISAYVQMQWRRQLWGTGARAPPQIAESNKNCLMKS
jgi:hypothetical protein